MKLHKCSRLVAIAVIAFITTVCSNSGYSQPWGYNTGVFQGLPEPAQPWESSIGFSFLNFISPNDAEGDGPSLRWYKSHPTMTLGHSLNFSLVYGTDTYLHSMFHTPNGLWYWTDANWNPALRMTQSGTMTIGGVWCNPACEQPIVLDPVAVGGPRITVAGGITAQTLDISSGVNFNGTVSLSGTTVSSFGRSLLDDANAAALRTTIGAAAQADILPLPVWRYDVVEQNQNYNNLSAANAQSLGSGITYWPSRNAGAGSYLMLDNTIGVGGHPRLLEYSRAHVLQRTITLQNFEDPEDIHWIAGNQFAISQEENNNGSDDEIVVITLPTGSGNENAPLASADRIIRMTSTFTSPHNNGIEGMALVNGYFYFAAEKAPAVGSPITEWSVWKTQNTGSGLVTTPTVTRAFRLAGITNARMADVSGMATDGTYLYILSHEGANYGSDANRLAPGRILKMTTDGRLIEDVHIPYFSDGGLWRQAEGIEVFVDGIDSKVKIALVGEVGNTPGSNVPGGPTTAVQYMLLSVP